MNVPGGTRFLFVGTSIIQQAVSASDDAGSPTISKTSRGAVSWAEVLSNCAFEQIVWHDPIDYFAWSDSRQFMGLNVGQSGFVIEAVARTFDHIDGRNNARSGNIEYDAIFLDLGTNEGASDDAETIAINKINAAEKFRTLNVPVVLFPIMVRDTTVTNYGVSDPARDNVHWANRLVEDYITKTQGVFLMDWNRPLIDPTTGGAQSGFLRDGIHPSAVGAYHQGKALADFVNRMFPITRTIVVAADDIYDATNNPRGNRLPNPRLTGTGGTVNASAQTTGVVADSYELEPLTGSGTATCAGSKAADPEGGEFQVLTFTLVGSGTDQFRFRTDSSNLTFANVGTNDWIQAEAFISVSDGDAIREIRVEMDEQGTGGLSSRSLIEADSVDWAFGESWEGTFRTPPINLLPATTAVRFRVIVTVNNDGSGSPVVSIGRVLLRNVADPRTLVNFTPPNQ